MSLGITASALRVELDCCLHLPQTRVGTGHCPVGEDSIFPGWLFDAAQSVGTTASLLEGGGTRQRGGGSCASLLFTPSVCIRRQLPQRGSLKTSGPREKILMKAAKPRFRQLCGFHKQKGPHGIIWPFLQESYLFTESLVFPLPGQTQETISAPSQKSNSWKPVRVIPDSLLEQT